MIQDHCKENESKINKWIYIQLKKHLVLKDTKQKDTAEWEIISMHHNAMKS